MGDEYAIELEDIREQIRRGRYTVCFTHTEQIRLRRIGIQEIEDAILNGTINEPYPDDPRGASCLILGYSGKGKALHVVCGNLKDDELLIITAYEPDEDEWEADLRTRK
jgi:hypothetical protein